MILPIHNIIIYDYQINNKLPIHYEYHSTIQINKNDYFRLKTLKLQCV